MNKVSNYKIMADKIRAAKTVSELNKLEGSATRLYNAGVFTVSEFSRLDGLIVDSHYKLENNTPKMKTYSKSHKSPKAASSHESKIKQRGGVVKKTKSKAGVKLSYVFPKDKQASLFK